MFWLLNGHNDSVITDILLQNNFHVTCSQYTYIHAVLISLTLRIGTWEALIFHSPRGTVFKQRFSLLTKLDARKPTFHKREIGRAVSKACIPFPYGTRPHHLC